MALPMKDPWLMRQPPKTVSRLRTLAVFFLLGTLVLLAMGLLWLLENHRF